MTSYKQLEANDCWRTCIAYILKVDPSTVPHFYKAGKELAVDLAQAYLKAKGLSMIKIALPGETPLGQIMQLGEVLTGSEFPYILSGRTPRGTDHAIVVNKGCIVLDPAIGRAPINGDVVFNRPLSNDVWSIEIIVGLLR